MKVPVIPHLHGYFLLSVLMIASWWVQSGISFWIMTNDVDCVLWDHLGGLWLFSCVFGLPGLNHFFFFLIKKCVEHTLGRAKGYKKSWGQKWNKEDGEGRLWE